MGMLAWALFTAVATIALVAAELANKPPAYRACKLLASTGFVGLALAAGALAHAYGAMVVAGLALSWSGDAFLLARGSRRLFLAGLGAFAGAHVAYAVAFALLAPSWTGALALAATLALLAVPGSITLRWLGPHLPAPMRRPVRVYVALISLMLASAAGAMAGDASPLVFAGALGFYLSDLFVARERFVRSGPLNRLLGLPLYYGAQLCLAWSTAP